MKAIQFARFGGPGVLEAVDLDTPQPRRGEVLVQVRAAGVNLSDTLLRDNRYVLTPPLPSVPGSEVAGIVAAVGEGVVGIALGNRVAASLFAAGVHSGGYAEYVTIDAAYVTPIPDALAFGEAAALMVQGTSALALARHTPVAGKTVLVNAAGGGVGTLLVQLLKRAGARQVIAAASSDAKRRHALALGADAAVDYTAAGWTGRLRELTGGVGPDVVFESVGGSITNDSLAALAPRGVMVIYGALNIQSFALGVPELLQLIFKNQAVLGFAAVPLLTPQLLRDDLSLLFDLTTRGALKVHFGGHYALADAAEAHRALGERRALGKLVLVP
jgi:NADPH2:quinone reductase